jgi:hypothetical protein
MKKPLGWKMHYLLSFIGIFIFVIGFLIYEKGGRQLFDLATASIFVLGTIALLHYIVKIIRSVLLDLRSKKTINESVECEKSIPQKDINPTVDEIKKVAAAKIEDGASDCAVLEYLIQNINADRLAAETIVGNLYQSRQKYYRLLGLLFIGIGGIILGSSFVFNEIMEDFLSGLNRWSAHQIGRYVHTVKLLLWAIALYYFIKGITRLVFGGEGVKIKRPF